MTDAIWVGILKPLFVLVFFALIVIPLRLLIGRLLPDGKLKQFLFKKR